MSPPSVTSRDASPAMVSSAEDAYVSWTVDAATKGIHYDVSVDDAPWVAVSGPNLKKVPVPAADSRTIRSVWREPRQAHARPALRPGAGVRCGAEDVCGRGGGHHDVTPRR